MSATPPALEILPLPGIPEVGADDDSSGSKEGNNPLFSNERRVERGNRSLARYPDRPRQHRSARRRGADR